MSGKPAEREFVAAIRRFFRRERRDFPWRRTTDPWAILVSEIMLQQTQTARVVPKFEAWMERYPRPGDLARAPRDEALALWSGLGYNRRCLALIEAAKAIDGMGAFPATEEELLALPGVGSYTARAVMAFAFNTPSVVVETNIRAVIIHFFFQDREGVKEREVAELVERTMDRRKPREWFWALMDYGAAMKRSGNNPARKSAGYKRQSRFEGSLRQARGRILKIVTARKRIGYDELASESGLDRERLDTALAALASEGFVRYGRGVVTVKA